MTDREKLYQYFMSYWCEDDPEIRALVTSWNENISDEAKKDRKSVGRERVF